MRVDKTPLGTGSERTGLRLAKAVARHQQFHNVHKSAPELAGEKGGAYVAISCVGHEQQPTIAVVTGTSDSLEIARRVGHEVAGASRA